MSLATRCTHCGTIFKIVEDQLKVSEGWVRCGRCNQVFNALPTLFDLSSEAPPPRATPPVAPPAPEPVHAMPAPPPPEHLPEPEAPPPAPSQLPDDEFPTEPAPMVAAATDFELDTAVSVRVSKPRPAPEPTPAPAWESLPPEDVPSTDEADALDSRYLMPTDRERLVAPRRARQHAPEFADAEFPDDAMLDAEEAWGSDFGPLEPPPSPATAPATRPSPLAPPPMAKVPATPSAPPPASAPAPTPEAARPVAPPAARAPTPRPKDEAPSRADAARVQLEQAVPPPSQRKGKSGTRGSAPTQETPEFLRRAQRQAFWRNPSTRGALFGLALALCLALLMQVTHHFRDLLAAYYPDSRPLFAAWCDTMGCRMSPPLRLDDLQVESATLVRASSEGPDRYRLAVVVRNRAPIEVAWPFVDLTLTDTNGATIARRVFRPSEAQWLDTADAKADTPSGSNKAASAARPAAPPAAVPSQRSTTLMWTLRATDIQPAGYTAELFYP